MQDNLKSTLKTAVENNDKAIIRRYLQTEHELNSPVDEDGNTLLHIASQYSRFAVAKAFIKAGAAKNRLNNQGYKAYECTSGRGKTHQLLQPKLLLTFHGMNSNSERFSRVADSIGLDYSAQNMTVIHLNAADYFDDGQRFSRSFALNIRSLLSGSVNHLEQLSQLRLNQTDIVELGRRLNLIKTEVEAMIERNGFDVNNVIFAGVSMGG